MKDYQKLKEVVLGMEADINKFESGTNSAGSRARKALQETKKLAQSLRMEIQSIKNGRK